jgi:CRP-like cAMP-binding protein
MTSDTKNRVLLSLAASTRADVLAACARVELEAGATLDRAGETATAVLLPETAVISTLADYSNGAMLDMANIGREACTGMSLILGNSTQLSTDEVQIAGAALRLPAAALAELRGDHPEFDQALLCTMQGLFYQVMVSGACNGSHDARQRLARWLLTMRDRVDHREMRLTHEFLAHMLGVRRATVTEAASGLRAEGLIDYAHGKVTVQDRAGLTAASCECYGLVKNAYGNLLPQPEESSAA